MSRGDSFFPEHVTCINLATKALEVINIDIIDLEETVL